MRCRPTPMSSQDLRERNKRHEARDALRDAQHDSARSQSVPDSDQTATKTRYFSQSLAGDYAHEQPRADHHSGDVGENTKRGADEESNNDGSDDEVIINPRPQQTDALPVVCYGLPPVTSHTSADTTAAPRTAAHTTTSYTAHHPTSSYFAAPQTATSRSETTRGEASYRERPVFSSFTFKNPPTADMSGSDSLNPGRFHGRPEENARSWFLSVSDWLRYRGTFDRPGAVQSFGCLMRDAALVWFQSLSPHETNSMDEFLRAFEERYITSATTKWKDLAALYQVKQGANQRVLEYITEVESRSQKVNADKEAIIAAVLNGLKPAIRAAVSQHERLDLDEIKKWARIAEEAGVGETGTAVDSATLRQLLEAVNELRENNSRRPIALLDNEYVAPLYGEQPQQSSTPAPQQSWQPPRNQRQQQYEQPHQQQFPPYVQQQVPQYPQPQQSYQQPQQYQGQRFQRQQQFFGPRPRYRQPQYPPREFTSSSGAGQQPREPCRNCGWVHRTATCPAVGKQCNFCGKLNHFQRVCRQARGQNAGAAGDGRWQPQPQQPQQQNVQQ